MKTSWRTTVLQLGLRVIYSESAQKPVHEKNQ